MKCGVPPPSAETRTSLFESAFINMPGLGVTSEISAEKYLAFQGMEPSRSHSSILFSLPSAENLSIPTEYSFRISLTQIRSRSRLYLPTFYTRFQVTLCLTDADKVFQVLRE